MQPRSRATLRLAIKGAQRGPASVKVALRDKDGTVVATDELRFVVIGDALAVGPLPPAGARVGSVGVSVSIVSPSGEQHGSLDSWGRLPAGLVANARRRGALQARQFISPGQRPGNGIVNEIKPCRGGIATVHGQRAPGIAPLQG